MEVAEELPDVPRCEHLPDVPMEWDQVEDRTARPVKELQQEAERGSDPVAERGSDLRQGWPLQLERQTTRLVQDALEPAYIYQEREYVRGHHHVCILDRSTEPAAPQKEYPQECGQLH